MSELLTQHFTLLEQWKENNELNQYREDILNDLHTELVRLQSTNAVLFRQELNKITGILRHNVLYIDEPMLTFLLDHFIRLLKQWYQTIHFSDNNDSKIFDNLGSIITARSDILSNELLIKEFIQCLYAIANIGKEMFTNEHISLISEMLKVYKNLESNYGTRFMEQTQYDDGIFKCLCSPYTTEVFSQLKSSALTSERTPAEDFVFNGLFNFFALLNREKLEEYSSALREHLLPSLSDLLDAFERTWDRWSESVIVILTDLTTIFLYSVQMTLTNDIQLSFQKHICDTVIRILSIPLRRSMKFSNNCLQYIYMGTLNDKVLDHLKGQQITSTMFKIAGFYKDEAEIQFNTYRVLASLMTEDDIKRLDDPGAIAKVFLDHLDEIKDRLGWETRIKNLLTTLKILLQHDQIRDEIHKLDGVNLFIYCVTTARYDELIQQRALENLLIMSFNDQVCQQLKENSSFMEHVKSISDNSTESDLQRAASSLIWRLTKDETSKDSGDKETSKTTYDVMISYSHKDKDLCFQLYDRLTKDHFRVWLDRDQMHGTPLESMSNAIENSEFVFVCMSDAYKQSCYCKMEAYYALEQQCCIIPLVMKAQYKADGWLGIIVTGRMRIDFPKHGFEIAYENLMTEIARNRREKKREGQSHHHEIPKTTKPSNDTLEKASYQLKKDHHFPSNIEQWTNDDVQQFLLKQQLECFLPICARMHGMRLVELYRMCVTNSPVMFQSLNHQLTMTKTEDKKRLIEIFEYLQFLEDLKPFVPILPLLPEKKDITVPQSAACALL